jgi:hypothetical protein
MPHPKLKIRLSRAQCDSESRVGLMGSTQRIMSSISVRLLTFLLQIFRDFIQFLCDDGIGGRECELDGWGRGQWCTQEFCWGGFKKLS